MIDFSTTNQLCIEAMLRRFRLDRPLTDEELSIRLLSMELRLHEVEQALGLAFTAAGPSIDGRKGR